VISAEIKTSCDSYVSLYVPDPRENFYRISITGSKLIIEYAFPFGDFSEDIIFEVNAWGPQHRDIVAAAKLLGFKVEDLSLDAVKVKRSQYAKILRCNDNLRKKFIVWLTDKYNIYSLGRYATWRPELWLDDFVNDVRQIISMVRHDHNYEGKKK
jgi:hypothetical protein